MSTPLDCSKKVTGQQLHHTQRLFHTTSNNCLAKRQMLGPKEGAQGPVDFNGIESQFLDLYLYLPLLQVLHLLQLHSCCACKIAVRFEAIFYSHHMPMSKMSVMLTCLTLAMTEGCQGFMRLNHPRHFSPLEVGALPQCRTYHKGGCCFGKATSCKPDSTE